jgi:hypothetical protein
VRREKRKTILIGKNSPGGRLVGRGEKALNGYRLKSLTVTI